MNAIKEKSTIHPLSSHREPDIYFMKLAVETEQEFDGRWIAEISQIPGALSYRAERREAISRVEALALRVFADRLELGEITQEVDETR